MFSSFNIGKYGTIIVGILCFLLLVLGILGLNFYTSFETEVNAEKVNIAGRQRMLSQRIAKSLSNTLELYQTDGNYRIAYNELRTSTKLFDDTLTAFVNSGLIPGTTSEIFTIEKIKTAEGRAALEKAVNVWTPLKKELQQLEENMQLLGIDSQESFARQNIFSLLKEATVYSSENEQQLLKLTRLMHKQAQTSSLSKEALVIAANQEIALRNTIKSLFEAANAYHLNDNFQPFARKLAKNAEVYDSALLAFKSNSSIFDELDEEISLAGLDTPEVQATIDKLLSVWKPLLNIIIRLENQSDINGVFDRDVRESLFSNVSYTQKNINALLSEMHALTLNVEQTALNSAEFSRKIQVAGIILALLIFGFIAQRFFGHIRVSDMKAAQAANETQQILDTVDQGLFLMDKNLAMGSQYSKEMVNIFADENISGRKFSSYVENLVSEKDSKKVQRFFNLLFDPHKKQQLLGDLNPLKQVSVQVKEASGRYVNKYLRFKFSRINDASGISKILTAVNDISEEVRLGQELERAAKKNEQQMELLSAIINSDSDMLPLFIQNAYGKFSKVNGLLKAPAKTTMDYRRKANSILSLVHSVKGESSALELEVITEHCHDFERHVIGLRDSEDLAGNDFLGLTVKLDQLINYMDLIRELYDQLFVNKQSIDQDKNAENSKASNWDHLYQFANDVADRQNKKVSMMIAGLDSSFVTVDMKAHLNTISIQLIRNSLVHGIETMDGRVENNKEPVGNISITLSRTSDGGFVYMFKDDGAGIDIEKIIRKAIDRGVLDSEQAGQLSKKAAAKLIITDEISTSNDVDFDAGRGAGMSAVAEAVDALKGNLSISTKLGKGVAFKVVIKSLNSDSSHEKLTSIAL